VSLLYLGFVVVSTLCMGLVDRRWRLFLFDRPRVALTAVAAGFVLFLVWDLVAIELAHYSKGDSPAMTGIEVAPELPLEELFFIVFLSYLTGVLHGLFRMLLDRPADAGPGRGPLRRGNGVAA
jgi:lycopene cyclase domain-containing protein